MSTALLITTDDKFREVEFENGLDFYYKHIECDMIEVAYLRALHEIGGLSNNFIMICDEEGLLKDNPKFNIYASAFCGTSIYGNAMIVKDDGEDFAGLEREDHEQLSLAIYNLLSDLQRHYNGN